MANNNSNTNKDKLKKLAADNSIPSEIKGLISKSLSRRTVLAGVGGQEQRWRLLHVEVVDQQQMQIRFVGQTGRFT